MTLGFKNSALGSNLVLGGILPSCTWPEMEKVIKVAEIDFWPKKITTKKMARKSPKIAQKWPKIAQNGPKMT